MNLKQYQEALAILVKELESMTNDPDDQYFLPHMFRAIYQYASPELQSAIEAAQEQFAALPKDWLTREELLL